jgi:mannose-6-phosphate isomerase-like protein (cupin superfamily)
MSDREVIQILGGLSIEIMVSSQSSNHTCCVFVETTPPGGGPPPHMHLREEEIFTVLEGSYEFYDGGSWSPMEVGVPVLSLRGNFHAFRNVGQSPARMMAMTNGGGIDEYFHAISGLRLPQDIDRLNDISAHYGYVYRPHS